MATEPCDGNCGIAGPMRHYHGVPDDAAVPDAHEGIDWSQHRGSCRVFYAERRCSCGAVPDPRFRDKLAEAAWGVLIEAARGIYTDPNVIAHAIVENQLPLIAAEVQARVQAAANQREAEAESAVIRATQLAQQWEINAQSSKDVAVATIALLAAGQLRAALAQPAQTTELLSPRSDDRPHSG